jgi:hypothetical protein
VSIPYRPSNGTEREWFLEEFCVRCWYDRNKDCPIIAESFIRKVKEWVCEEDGSNSRCLQFLDHVKVEPKEYPIDEISQLKLFEVSE